MNKIFEQVTSRRFGGRVTFLTVFSLVLGIIVTQWNPLWALLYIPVGYFLGWAEGGRYSYEQMAPINASISEIIDEIKDAMTALEERESKEAVDRLWT